MNVRIGIKHIIHKGVGEDMVDSFVVEDASKLFAEDEMLLHGPLTGEVYIKKFDTFLGVTLRKVHVTVSADCGRCEKDFEHTIEDGTSSMREFYTHVPEEFYKEELLDVFQVDTGRNLIDITEMLRQELILMLPTALYCSRTECSPMREEGPVEKQTFQPFAGLKDMMEE